jgi:hypothetical protein
MVLQPPQASVRSGSQSLLASSGVAQSEAEIAQPKEALIGVATGPLAPRFAIGPERACTLLPTTPTMKTVASLAQD